MKLVRYGPRGQEKPGVLDDQGRIRCLEAHVADITGVVARAQFRGDHYLLRVRVGPEQAGLEVSLASGSRARPGDVVGFRIDAARLRWFAAPDSHPSQI